MCRHSQRFDVSVSGQAYRCIVKGLQQKSGQAVLVGDHVLVDSLDNINQTGRICRILPRQNELDRPKVSNITTLLVMVAVAEPAFDLDQLDRYITLGLIQDLTVRLCFTKRDLCTEDDPNVQEALNLYCSLGIPVSCISIHQPETVTALISSLKDEIVVLAGPSGVGKSSFINAFQPSLDLRVGDVSEKLGRGTHTTRNETLIQLNDSTWVVDTPGFSHLTLDRVIPSKLIQAFPELKALNCLYPDCVHDQRQHEELGNEAREGCELASNPEKIAASRYANYLQFLSEAQSYETRLRDSTQKEHYGFKKTETTQSDRLRLQGKHRQVSRRRLTQDAQDWELSKSDDLELDEATELT